jgi:hypothetical protein
MRFATDRLAVSMSVRRLMPDMGRGKIAECQSAPEEGASAVADPPCATSAACRTGAGSTDKRRLGRIAVESYPWVRRPVSDALCVRHKRASDVRRAIDGLRRTTAAFPKFGAPARRSGNRIFRMWRPPTASAPRWSFSRLLLLAQSGHSIRTVLPSAIGG